ncbi:hypothetical protein SPBR_04603 [Sporothrix brasiliensis 5110]|uniref:C2H2-type domain-containing protein n=1 Tax=Sporothrix brasiliensis 5110 TaxID=1398154 RepID=A0A0C2IQE6_9PEZI|nr:uncharacterized protein SPBR_04603 [Sporothrix brasiliensis 5110]KIH87282.1 hypothetical protein SPBR_04603 [Sporothrix brasiliensis 5110]
MASREERQQPPHRLNDNRDDVRNDSCRFACSSCGRSFKRLEHLGRHRQSHQAVKRYACPVCLKRFARSDILLRHTLLHRSAAGPAEPRAAASSGRPLPSASAAPGRPRKERRRACQACAKAHESCSKGAPCQRCLVRSVQCVYSTSTSTSTMDGGGQDGQDGQDGQGGHGASSAAEPVPATTAAAASFFAGTTAAVDQAPAPFVDVPFQDSTAEAVTLLLDMQTDMQTDMQASMQTGMQTGMPAGDQLMPAYNNWAAQGLSLPPDGPTLNFSINWLPENLHSDLDYVSILGPSLHLMSSDLVTSQLEQPSSSFPFQQMHLPVEQAPLHADLTLSNAMPPLLHNSGDRLGSSASTSPVASPVTASGHTPPGTNRTARHLYTNGANGVRAPCTVRDTRDYVPIPGTKPLPAISAGMGGGVSDATRDRGRVTSAPRLPSLSHISVAHVLPAGASAHMHIWPSTYEHIRHGIRHASRADPGESALDDHAIPTLEQTNYFAHLYFEKCNPVLPILHDYIGALNESWLLALAVATVGAQYTFTEEFTACAAALHEILQRALQMALDDDDTGHGTCSLATVQALFLSQVGLLYHGPSRLLRRTKVNHSILVDMLRCHQLLEPSTTRQTTVSASVETQWRQWVHDESRRRLGYAIWLFVDKLIKPDIGEFSRILLLHGVYQEIWLVKRYCDRPLVSWEAVPDRVVDRAADRAVDRSDAPLAASASASTATSVAPSPPPSTDTASGDSDAAATTYSNWRNAACDCIDALHWAANSTIAQRAGREHTTVFHLHFSRVVLLTPYEAIQTLARYLASVGASPSQSASSSAPSPSPSPSRAQGLAAERRVLAWAQQDEHKARLAVLHCGCLFWHVRRYSTNAWYEPVAVYMAALALWAYSSYARQGVRPSDGDDGDDQDDRPDNPGDNLSDDDQFPSFIHLDRPNDDEMVMLFVRSGRPSVMRAYISGIGDIGAPPAPVRILQEGAKVLAKVSMAWGRTDRFLYVLTGMRAALTKAAE